MVEKSSGGAGSGGGGEAKERKGLWSPEEDERLYTQITRQGVSTWSSVAQLAGLRRSGKSCRLRWMNYLRPDLKKEPISRREEETIVSLQKSLGNRWSVIAARMPGRTDNEIKNYWNSRIRKRQSATAGGKAGGCANAADPPAAAETTPELTPAEEKEPVSAATAAAAFATTRLPVFACQLHGGGGDGAIAAAGTGTTQSTTTHEQNGAGSESEVSVGNGGGGGEDAREEEHYYYCAGNGSGDMDMIHLLSFDDLEYPAGDLLLQLDDAWDQSQLYSANSRTSS